MFLFGVLGVAFTVRFAAVYFTVAIAPPQHTAPTAPVASTIQAIHTAPTAPVASTIQAIHTAPTAPIASIIQAIRIAPTAPIASIIQAIHTAPEAPIAPVASTIQVVHTAPAEPAEPKQLSPDRPEVLMQAYLAKKAAWLAQHHTVRLTEYRKARKWKNPRPKVLKEQSFYMPKERRDLNSNIIAMKANWTNKEIIVWLDNEDRRQEEEYNRLELEFVGNGNRFAKNEHRDIWARIKKEHARDAKRYIL
jgi:hypothetical protein